MSSDAVRDPTLGEEEVETIAVDGHVARTDKRKRGRAEIVVDREEGRLKCELSCKFHLSISRRYAESSLRWRRFVFLATSLFTLILCNRAS